MIKAIIVEDDPQHYHSLKEMLGRATIPVDILSFCPNVRSAVENIHKLKPELIFLDIDLGNGESGFDLLRKFENPNFSVIFTTQYNTTDNAVAALRACALDFLAKPLMISELNEALARYDKNKKTAVEQTQTLKSNLEAENGAIPDIWIKSTDGDTRIKVANIIYCKSNNVYTTFYLATPVQKKDIYVSSESIKHWEVSFKNTWICRIHNEFLANLTFVEAHRNKGAGATLTMINGLILNVSKSRKERVETRLNLCRKLRK